MTTLAQGNARLLRLAAYVERRQRAKPRKGYSQYHMWHGCGAPACFIGHAAVLFNKRFPSTSPAKEFFGLPDLLTVDLLFAPCGCNNAGTDWRKAVAYVRAFVAQRSAK